MTTFIAWDELLETGLTEVDRHHRHLVDLTNALGKGLSTNDVSNTAIQDLFLQLVDYTRYHFEEEEKISVQAEVDQRHRADHELEHQTFMNEINTLYQKNQQNLASAGSYLFDFLLNWLIYHILGSDMAMARQIRKITTGISPQAAYEQEGHHSDKKNALLLRSLKNLFAQVSERNQQLSELNSSLEERVKQRTRELESANTHLENLASTDVLTGLVNRRRALEILRLLWQEEEKDSQPLACMMIDADNFKQINDRYGHDAGDEVLRVLAREMIHAVRTDDSVCRLGGDEFMIICPATDATGAMHLAQTLRKHIASLQVPAGDGFWHGSVSIGVAARQAEMNSIDELIKAADRHVYQAKAAGRNCVRANG